MPCQPPHCKGQYGLLVRPFGELDQAEHVTIKVHHD
jgi:hypothetical protein